MTHIPYDSYKVILVRPVLINSHVAENDKVKRKLENLKLTQKTKNQKNQNFSKSEHNRLLTEK